MGKKCPICDKNISIWDELGIIETVMFNDISSDMPAMHFGKRANWR